MKAVFVKHRAAAKRHGWPEVITEMQVNLVIEYVPCIHRPPRVGIYS